MKHIDWMSIVNHISAYRPDEHCKPHQCPKASYTPECSVVGRLLSFSRFLGIVLYLSFHTVSVYFATLTFISTGQHTGGRGNSV